MSVSLNFLLIPEFGIYGAAFSLLLSTISLSASQKYFSKKGFYIKMHINLYLSILLLLSFIGWVLTFINASLFVGLAKLAFIVFLGILILKYNYLLRRLLSIAS